MALYYADYDLATGADDGSSWADAFQTPVSAESGTAGGDTILERGSATLGANLTYTAAGQTTPRIWVGVGASGSVEAGVRVTIDCNSSYRLTVNSYNFFENRIVDNASGNAVTCTSYTSHYNCIIRNASSYGLVLSSYSVARKCQITGNANGVTSGSSSNLLSACEIFSNTGGGCYFPAQNVVLNCLFYDNPSYNMATGQNCTLSNCTFDDSAKGLDTVGFSGAHAKVEFCLFSNCTIGLKDNPPTFSYLNAYYNNGTDVETPSYDYYVGYEDSIISLGADPYTDQSNDDYEIQIDNSDIAQISTDISSTNTTYITLGAVLPQSPSTTTPTYTAGDLKVEANSHGGFDFTVSAGSNITYYEIYIDTSSLGWGTDEIAGAFLAANATTFSLYTDASGDALVNGTAYYIGIRALNVGTNARDTNTTELTLAPKGASGKFVVRQQPGGAPQ